MKKKLKYTHQTWEFFIENTLYVFIHRALVAQSYISYGNGQAGVWKGNTNIKGSNESRPVLAFENLQQAFQNVQSYSADYGLVKDFDSHTLYYDNDEVLEYMKKLPAENKFLKKKIKVEHWNYLPV